MSFKRDKPTKIMIRITKKICVMISEFENKETELFSIKTARLALDTLEKYEQLQAYDSWNHGPSEFIISDISWLENFIKDALYWCYEISEEVRDKFELEKLFEFKHDWTFFEFDENGILFARFCTPFMGNTKTDEPQQITRIKVFPIYDVKDFDNIFEIQLISDDDDNVLFSSIHNFVEGERILFTSVDEFCAILNRFSECV